MKDIFKPALSDGMQQEAGSGLAPGVVSISGALSHSPRLQAVVVPPFQVLLLLTASHFRQGSHEKLSFSGTLNAKTMS